MKITSAEFENEVINSELPVLVDFFATWCGPCKMMSPIVEELEEELKGKVKVFKVDVDEERDLAEKYNVMSIPTFIVFKNGQAVGTALGMQDKEELLNLLNK